MSEKITGITYGLSGNVVLAKEIYQTNSREAGPTASPAFCGKDENRRF